MGDLAIVQKIAIYALPVIFAITVHEAAHAFVASRHGDNTAELFGRLTLNPLRHIDPIGTILLPLLGMLFGGFIFGWAKPVPINFTQLHNPKRDLLWVALAGPMANFAMALIWALLFKASLYLNSYLGIPLRLMSQAGIEINIILMLINLIPLLPLDGGRIMFSLLPAKAANEFAKIEPYGIWILFLLLLIGGLNFIIRPIFISILSGIYFFIQNQLYLYKVLAVNSIMEKSLRILSGMRSTGRLHLGHYYGAIKNWVNLQYEYNCYFMVADLHALTTNYEDVKTITQSIYEMVIDWIACGIDPSQAVIFIQSHVPEHSELHLLLSMITPLSWLERVPTYKEQIEKLTGKDLYTYGFLGYPLLQSADILLYNAKFVPVGEDQLSHVELTREIARRFNYLYGREEGFEEKAYEAIKKLGAKKAALYTELLVKYQQEGEEDALEKARFLLQDAINLSSGEQERLFAFLENKSRVILTEPQALITEHSRLPGLDGQKMSKSYNNTIMLRESPAQVEKKIKGMQTDPARIRRTDPGDPEKCPVWQLHKVYSNDEVKEWAQTGCRTAGIGCLDCKGPVINAIKSQQEIFSERAAPYLEDHNMIRNLLADGAERASEVAKQTLITVKRAMGLI